MKKKLQEIFFGPYESKRRKWGKLLEWLSSIFLFDLFFTGWALAGWRDGINDFQYLEVRWECARIHIDPEEGKLIIEDVEKPDENKLVVQFDKDEEVGYSVAWWDNEVKLDIGGDDGSVRIGLVCIPIKKEVL